MKTYLIKTLWFILGFIIFIVIEGVAYHGVNAVDPTNKTGAAGVAFIGGLVFTLWALVLGFLSARKNQYNFPFITGATIAYVIASTSLKPILISLVIFSLWNAAYKRKHIKNAS